MRTLEAQPGWRLIDFGEVWKYRELLYFMTWRDIKVRYKQTVLGAAWAILQPLATMLAFSLFFGRLAANPASGVPYPLFVLTGLLPWTFFANAMSSASQSVVGNQGLVTKVYFPRLIIPMGAVAAGLVDFAIALGLLMLTMAYYRFAPGAAIVWAPVLILCLITIAFGAGTLLAALTVEYRDFRHIIPFMLQIWMFATPAIYLQEDSTTGSRLGMLTALNPLNRLISGFRAAMLGGHIDPLSQVPSLLWGLAALIAGSFYFRRVERRFADII